MRLFERARRRVSLSSGTAGGGTRPRRKKPPQQAGRSSGASGSSQHSDDDTGTHVRFEDAPASYLQLVCPRVHSLRTRGHRRVHSSSAVQLLSKSSSVSSVVVHTLSRPGVSPAAVDTSARTQQRTQHRSVALTLLFERDSVQCLSDGDSSDSDGDTDGCWQYAIGFTGVTTADGAVTVDAVADTVADTVAETVDVDSDSDSGSNKDGVVSDVAGIKDGVNDSVDDGVNSTVNDSGISGILSDHVIDGDTTTDTDGDTDGLSDLEAPDELPPPPPRAPTLPMLPSPLEYPIESPLAPAMPPPPVPTQVRLSDSDDSMLDELSMSATATGTDTAKSDTREDQHQTDQTDRNQKLQDQGHKDRVDWDQQDHKDGAGVMEDDETPPVSPVAPTESLSERLRRDMMLLRDDTSSDDDDDGPLLWHRSEQLHDGLADHSDDEAEEPIPLLSRQALRHNRVDLTPSQRKRMSWADLCGAELIQPRSPTLSSSGHMSASVPNSPLYATPQSQQSTLPCVMEGVHSDLSLRLTPSLTLSVSAPSPVARARSQSDQPQSPTVTLTLRSCLKRRPLRPEDLRQRKRQCEFLELLQREQKHAETCRHGARVYKVGPGGKKQRRFFQVSGDVLRWSTHKATHKVKSRQLPLYDLIAMWPGNTLGRFRESPDVTPWRCLTLAFMTRDVQLLFATDEEFIQWFLGIQSVAPMSRSRRPPLPLPPIPLPPLPLPPLPLPLGPYPCALGMSRGALLWWRMKQKLRLRSRSWARSHNCEPLWRFVCDLRQYDEFVASDLAEHVAFVRSCYEPVEEDF
ncbi:MAG: hypothetical protein MHM6MM_008150 [Cercozoa sp. M6MM]